MSVSVNASRKGGKERKKLKFHIGRRFYALCLCDINRQKFVSILALGRLVTSDLSSRIEPSLESTPRAAAFSRVDVEINCKFIRVLPQLAFLLPVFFDFSCCCFFSRKVVKTKKINYCVNFFASLSLTHSGCLLEVSLFTARGQSRALGDRLFAINCEIMRIV